MAREGARPGAGDVSRLKVFLPWAIALLLAGLPLLRDSHEEAARRHGREWDLRQQIAVGSEDHLGAGRARVAAGARGREQGSRGGLPAQKVSWRDLIQPNYQIYGHRSQRQEQVIQALREAASNPFGEGAEVEETLPGADRNTGGGWPGELKLAGHPYRMGGEGFLRAEPFMPKKAGFYIVNDYQKAGTYDSFYIRLVGPSIVVATAQQVAVKMGAETNQVKYQVNYDIKEAGIYTIQIWVEYQNLPLNVTAIANPRGEDPDPLVANSETFDRVDRLLYQGLVDVRYQEGSAASAAELARSMGAGSWGGIAQRTQRDPGSGRSERQCATGLLPGRWVVRTTTACPPGQKWGFLNDPWDWQPAGCRVKEFCGAEAQMCVHSLQSVTIAGDSIAREIFDDVGSALLQQDVSWREIFVHKHASGVREVDGTMIRMLWLPDPMKTIAEQLNGPIQNREQYTSAKVLVISAGYWYIYRRSLESYLLSMQNLIRVIQEKIPRTKVVWLTIPSGWMNFGYRIRPRIQRWNEQSAKLAEEADWTVVDLFHLTDARPEKTDGTHIGNDTDHSNMLGEPVLSRTATNLLLGALCASNSTARSPRKRYPKGGVTVEWPDWPASRKFKDSKAILKLSQKVPPPPPIAPPPPPPLSKMERWAQLNKNAERKGWTAAPKAPAKRPHGKRPRSNSRLRPGHSMP